MMRVDREMPSMDYQKLMRFIETEIFECACELVILFGAIKFKSAEGLFDKERCVDFYIEFFRARKRSNLASEKKCDPLQEGDLDRIMMIVNKEPVSQLLKVGILKTFERFDPEVFKIVFENEEVILAAIRKRIVNHFVESVGDSKVAIEKVLKTWERAIDSRIRADALTKVSGSIEKINLEFFLKYLFQSYSAGAFKKFLESFKIDEAHFDEFFKANQEFFAKFIKDREKAEVVVAKTQKEVVVEENQDHLKDLMSFYKEMQEEEEDYRKPPKKKKK